MKKEKNKNPYESHNRQAICALCQLTYDEKMIKIFVYHGKISKNKVSINVCRKCEDKKSMLENLAQNILAKSAKEVK
jgi:hypothetical protein